MGCGVSMMDAEDAAQSRLSNGPLRRHWVARPVTAKKLPAEQGSVDSSSAQQARKSVSRQGKDVILVMKPILSYHEGSGKQGCLDGKKIEDKRMEKQERVNGEEEEENIGRDDMIKRGQGSLSFRDYCIDYDSDGSSCKRKSLVVEPSFKDLCNDFDSRQSSKNEGDGNSTEMLNKPQDKEGLDLNKGPVKKERRRRVPGNKERGKSGKKKNFPKFSHREKS